MPDNAAYRNAEKKIAQARRSAATELDLSGFGIPESEKLTELPESLGQLTQLQTLNLFDNQLTRCRSGWGSSRSCRRCTSTTTN